MDILNYIENAKRTETNPRIEVGDAEDGELGSYVTTAIDGRLKVRMVHVALGLCSELEELQSAVVAQDQINVGEELADIMWYWAIAVDCLPSPDFIVAVDESNPALSGRTFSSPRSEYGALIRAISQYADYAKKYAFYDRAPDTKKVTKALCDISKAVFNLMWDHGLRPTEMLDRNIAKLRVRFPDKFTKTAANHRDLDAERKVLEGG